MSKLFIGMDIPKSALTQVLGIFDNTVMEDPQENYHITFQYCGKEIKDEHLPIIAGAWMDGLKGLSETDRELGIGTKLSLFGKENDVLVVNVHVSDAFKDAIEVARLRAIELVKEIVSSDFPFSAHVTLGKAHTLPKVNMDGMKEYASIVNLKTVKFWGDDYSVRSEADLSKD